MKSILKFFFLLSIATIFASCDKEDCCIGTNEISGKWAWVQTTGWTIKNPETLGAAQTLRIDDQIFRHYVDDTLVYSSEYELVHVQTPSGTHTRIDFADGTYYDVTLEGSKLTLGHTALFDSDLHEYKRS